jgi:pimeloyl-ACP methyl ester carboxylesterase
MTPATFVLVHGAWHGGWCWERVAAILRAGGDRVYAPTLAGLGERASLATPGIDLSTHVAEVRALIETEDLTGVVLCGHSYGGAVVSVVADRIPERIGALVYLDAFVPADGESMLDVMLPELREKMIAAAAASPNGTVPPLPAERFRVNPRDRELVDRTCVPQPFATFTESARLTGALERIPRTYIRAAAYPNAVFERSYERFREDASWTTHAVACGHDVMLDAPEELAALLRGAASPAVSGPR